MLIQTTPQSRLCLTPRRVTLKVQSSTTIQPIHTGIHLPLSIPLKPQAPQPRMLPPPAAYRSHCRRNHSTPCCSRARNQAAAAYANRSSVHHATATPPRPARNSLPNLTTGDHSLRASARPADDQSGALKT
eukprot:3142264-Pleurochrysis_carterae.AAC.1